jgi:hypothetical protein
MTDISAGWELVSRRAGASSSGLFRTLRQAFSSTAAENTQAIVTWTVRHRATGLVRRLTAHTELEARVKIANGLFDAA